MFGWRIFPFNRMCKLPANNNDLFVVRRAMDGCCVLFVRLSSLPNSQHKPQTSRGRYIRINANHITIWINKRIFAFRNAIESDWAKQKPLMMQKKNCIWTAFPYRIKYTICFKVIQFIWFIWFICRRIVTEFLVLVRRKRFFCGRLTVFGIHCIVSRCQGEPLWSLNRLPRTICRSACEPNFLLDRSLKIVTNWPVRSRICAKRYSNHGKTKFQI